MEEREAERLDGEAKRNGNVVTISTDGGVVQLVQDGTRVTYLQGPDQATVTAMSSAVED
jgi:hypothetical protein